MTGRTEPEPTEPLIIAIDGPAGVGKTTAARALAEYLDIPYLETGAMYRAVGLKALELGIDPEDRRAVAAMLDRLDLRLEGRRRGRIGVLLDGEPLGERIRSSEVGEATSKVSAHAAVRRRLVALQRESARRHGAVVEGRDIGTKVFPQAAHKFFLDAAPAVRVRRRLEQMGARGEVLSSTVEEEIARRDVRDSQREESPLARDPSYVFIDTGELGAEQVVERMLEELRAGRKR